MLSPCSVSLYAVLTDFLVLTPVTSSKGSQFPSLLSLQAQLVSELKEIPNSLVVQNDGWKHWQTLRYSGQTSQCDSILVDYFLFYNSQSSNMSHHKDLNIKF